MFQSLLKKFLIWRLRHISNKRFVIILSIVIGVAVGFAAVIIKNAVHYIQHLLTEGLQVGDHNYLFFIYPFIGLLITVLLIKFVIKREVGHGVPATLYAISKNNSILKSHNLYSSIITSSITVGFGGSVGLEGPTVATGAAVGSNTGRLFHLSYKEITLLVGCASAGAMAAIFKAPIAAIVFAIEVIMLDLTMASIVPLLIASTTAALTSFFFLGKDVLYPFEIKAPFILHDLHLYIILGILTALISVYFFKMYSWIQKFFEQFKSPFTRLFIGAGMLGILVFLFPSLYGEGYNEINSCLNGNYSYFYVNNLYSSLQNNIFVFFLVGILIVLLKVIATSVTFGGGGIGGIFAPTLFMGANFGMLYGVFLNHFDLATIEVSNFALVGMGGLIAGVLHAPLTAIFLIAEITGGYELFMPLMITATISYITTKYFIPNSVYTKQLAERKELITHDKDKAVLTMMKINKLIETDFKTIHIDAKLGDLVDVVGQSQRNIFPVIDENNNYYGIVTLDNIRNIMFSPELYDKTEVRSLLFMPEVSVSPEDSMEDVAQKFHINPIYNMPVIKDGKYIGFVSRANVFSTYRRLLKKFSED